MHGVVDLHDLVTTKTNAVAIKPHYLADIEEKLKSVFFFLLLDDSILFYSIL